MSKVKKAKKTSDDDDGLGGVAIDMSSHVSLTFSLKYLVNFSKSAALAETVQLMMSNEVPLLVSATFVLAVLCSLGFRYLMTSALAISTTTWHLKSVTNRQMPCTPFSGI